MQSTCCCWGAKYFLEIDACSGHGECYHVSDLLTFPALSLVNVTVSWPLIGSRRSAGCYQVLDLCRVTSRCNLYWSPREQECPDIPRHRPGLWPGQSPLTMLVTSTRWWGAWSAPGVMTSNEQRHGTQGVRTRSGHWVHPPPPGGHTRHQAAQLSVFTSTLRETDGWAVLTPRPAFQLLLTFCNLNHNNISTLCCIYNRGPIQGDETWTKWNQ